MKATSEIVEALVDIVSRKSLGRIDDKSVYLKQITEGVAVLGPVETSQGNLIAMGGGRCLSLGESYDAREGTCGRLGLLFRGHFADLESVGDLQPHCGVLWELVETEIAFLFVRTMTGDTMLCKEGLRLHCLGKAWEKADMSLTTTEVTKRVVLESMGGIEDFLEFTVETAEDEGFGGWTIG